VNCIEGHFEQDKTLILMFVNYYWPRLFGHISNFITRCVVSQRFKRALTNVGLSTSLIGSCCSIVGCQYIFYVRFTSYLMSHGFYFY
jgi:hypothetical protein